MGVFPACVGHPPHEPRMEKTGRQPHRPLRAEGRDGIGGPGEVRLRSRDLVVLRPWRLTRASGAMVDGSGLAPAIPLFPPPAPLFPRRPVIRDNANVTPLG
jgi:hypothetical protein